MIELPEWAVPLAATPTFVDAGGIMRSPINTTALKVNRPGSHYRLTTSFPPFEPAQGRVIVSRLIRAQREGLRLPFTLADAQPAIGAPVVNGAGQSGMTIRLRGLTFGATIKEGSWLSIRSAGGWSFLHNVAADATVSGTGAVDVLLSEMLREPFPNGAPVELEHPVIQGLVLGSERDWQLSVDSLTEIGFTVEEAR